MDFEKMKQKMHEWFESEEGKKSVENFGKKLKIEDDRKKHMWSFLESLSDEQFDELLPRFIKWEEKFEGREYDKGKLKASNIWNNVFGVITDYAPQYENDDMFFGGGATYRGYQWIVYIGQGSFYTIEKDGERIFTST